MPGRCECATLFAADAAMANKKPLVVSGLKILLSDNSNKVCEAEH